MSDTTHLQLPYLAAAQAQKHVTHNEALTLLDGLVQAAVKSRALASPPVSPADGDRYLIAASPTGAWAGQAGKFALRMEGAWRFLAPVEGWSVWIDDEDVALSFNGTAWVAAGAPTVLQNLSLLGVNASADVANKLTVASAATLFNHVGNGHQIKINKNAAADTASVLYQTGFSGRAEIGTTGDDDFHVKVSADGTAFHEALVIAGATGAVTAKKILRLEPQAGDPAAPVDGQLWYNATSNSFRKRQNGSTSDLDTGGGGGGGGAVAWGAITGTLASQSDLQAALTGKSEIGHGHALSAISDVTITAANLNALDDGANTGLHFHDADRARANHTGLQVAATISDFAAAADARVSAGMATHLAAGDPHPQYLTPAEGNAAYAASGHSHSGLAPVGGSTGQVLKKNSAANFDYSWQADATGGGGGGGSLATASHNLTSNVSLSAYSWADANSISLAAGTWLVTAHVTIQQNGTNYVHNFARITDGTTHYASGLIGGGTATGTHGTIAMTALITLASTTTIKTQGLSTSSAAGPAIVAQISQASGNTATQIAAVKIA